MDIKEFKEIRAFVEKKMGKLDSIEVIEDNGKTIWLQINDEEEEIENGSIIINRRQGYDGNYRVISSNI